MKTFKSITDVVRFRDHPLHATVQSLVSAIINDYPEYRPEDDGYLVLIEPADVDRVLDDLDMPYRLSEVPFEGVTMINGCFLAVYPAQQSIRPRLPGPGRGLVTGRRSTASGSTS
jgi:hypothetical protein